MNFSELCNEVSINTGRGDLLNSGEIGTAVKRATMKMHSINFWPQDLAEAIVGFKTNPTTGQYDFNQTMIIAEEMARFRAVKYIREYRPANQSVSSIAPYMISGWDNNGDEMLYYTKQDPDAMLDEFNATASNVWYIGGSNLNLRGRLPVQAVSIGWYQYPIIDPLAFSSWIAEQYPYAIIDEATRMINKLTGYLDIAANFDGIVAEHIQIMIQNFVDGEGR
jgi:hypothetical protein